jgi:hypothetical protein
MGSPPPGELYPGAAAVLQGLGRWLGAGRAEAFDAVKPGPLAFGAWGTCVQRDGVIYLHLPPGPAAGWPRRRLRLEPLPAGMAITAVRQIPDGQPVPFTQDRRALTLELEVVVADPVLSLLALETSQTGPAPAAA